MRPSKLLVAKPKIIRFFKATQQRVWTRRQIEKAFWEMREEWELARKTSTDDFLEFLINETHFVQTALAFPYLIDFTERFWWGEPTVYEIAMSLHPRGFFSHHTALSLHELTKEDPTIVYYNIEQTATGTSKGRLQQSSITAAFQRPPRISNNRAIHENTTFCLLSGKNTGNLGVIENKRSNQCLLRLTSIERTLIDCSVRPVYSNGPSSLLIAYQAARNKISVPVMAELLEKLKYIYPYHQVIGFYLDRSGVYSNAEVDLFQRKTMTHDFYLDYQMTKPNYSKKWRLYYPAELDAS